MESDFILLAGIPGTGKTFYGEHLETVHGYHHIETDRGEVGLAQNVWSEILPPSSVYVSSLMQRYGNVVLEWSFKVDFVPPVLGLGCQGARLVWFFADLDLARRAFARAKRDDQNEMKAFDIQVQQIRNAHLPTKEFLQVETLTRRRPLSPSEVDAVVGPRGECQ